MKGTTGWSYKPYKPLLYEVGDVYISRVAPTETSIHVEWIGKTRETYKVFYRVRGEKDFVYAGESRNAEFDIVGLESDTDYEFYVADGEKKSRVRLARCGEFVGTVVNYLHPDDEAYDFSGRYLCSPSLLRHPDGYLLSSMDVFRNGGGQNLTMIFRSDDDGKSWRYVCDLFPCFWGKLFLHRGDVYMLGCSTEYGDLLIGKSPDGGMSFGVPNVLLRGTGGKNAVRGGVGVHKNPQNVVKYDGRIYETLEWGSWQNADYGHAAMVMSADENSDLLDPASWSFTEPLKFGRWCDELADLPLNTMMIEGTLTVAPDGRLKNVMRFGKFHNALVLDVDTERPEAPLRFERLMPFPANFSKFTIKRDDASGFYYTIASATYDESHAGARNLLSLLRSRDLNEWETVIDLFDFRDRPCDKVGFQYADFEFDGEDIIFLCRTALNNAASYHDTNYQTFHRIANFRREPRLK